MHGSLRLSIGMLTCSAWLKTNSTSTPMAKSIKKRVPEREFRRVLQNETKGTNQQRASHVQYDWVRIFTPKV